MKKKVNILDYSGKRTEIEIDNFETVGAIDLTVVSGDEILTVIRKDFTVEKYDSSNDRTTDYFDGEYRIYKEGEEQNMIDDKEWQNRKTSYDY